jgi:hypothetical protein
LRRDPRDEATLEGLGVERGQNVAQGIVRGRTVLEPPQAFQERQFHSAKPGDIGDRLRPGHHSQKAEQQNFVERIFNLAGLAGIRQILEGTEEDNRFVNRATVVAQILHRNPPPGESADFDDSDLHQFVQKFFTRSPWPHGRKHLRRAPASSTLNS